MDTPPDSPDRSAESRRSAPDRRPSLLSVPDDVPPAVVRRGRTLATVVFLAVVAVFTLTQAGQITKQVMFPEVVPSGLGCEQSLASLHGALERARTAGEADLDQDTALARFRAALDPEWATLEGARANCSSAEQRRSLDALERLRYAEEHAVRREAASLAALRRQVAADIAKHTKSPAR
jgi:hypothetical protein